MIELVGISKAFKLGKVELAVLEHVSLSIKAGEIVAILGPSGCGKTTLLRIICGLDSATDGEVLIDGNHSEAPLRRRLCSLMFQEPALLEWLSTKENIDVFVRIANRRADKKRAIANGEFDELLERVGLNGFGHAYPDQLSVGMKARVSLVRSLALDRPILLMDEPFAALDELNRIDMYSVLARCLEQSRSTVVFVTHLVEEAAALADRTIVLTGRPARVSGIVEASCSLRERLSIAADGGMVSTARKIRQLLGVNSYA